MSMSALSVMVVEDHGFQRRMALRLLSKLGVSEVLEAADGNRALQVLTARGQPPDVVMVDLDMPGMDGIEFIGHLAQRHLARSVLVVSALDPALLNHPAARASPTWSRSRRLPATAPPHSRRGPCRATSKPNASAAWCC